MSSFLAKDELVQGRQLKVQELAIPFTITGNATPASVVLRNDEPAILFMKSEGVNQITTTTGALDSGETATYTVAANDAAGKFNMLVKLNADQAAKVVCAQVISRTDGVAHPCFLGDADGISSAGKIMLTCDSTVDLSAANLDACLVVKYVVVE